MSEANPYFKQDLKDLLAFILDNPCIVPLIDSKKLNKACEEWMIPLRLREEDDGN